MSSWEEVCISKNEEHKILVLMIVTQIIFTRLLVKAQSLGAAVSLVAGLGCLDVVGAGHGAEEGHVGALPPGRVPAHHLRHVVPGVTGSWSLGQ